MVTLVFEAEAKLSASWSQFGLILPRELLDHALGNIRRLGLPRVYEPALERRGDDQVHEREDGRDDQQQGQAEPGADGPQVTHGSRSR